METAMKVLPFALSPLAGVGALIAKPPKPVAPPAPVTRNMAAEAAMADTAMRARRGAGATELVPRSRGEARTPGGKVLLGQ